MSHLFNWVNFVTKDSTFDILFHVMLTNSLDILNILPMQMSDFFVFLLSDWLQLGRYQLHLARRHGGYFRHFMLAWLTILSIIPC